MKKMIMIKISKIRPQKDKIKTLKQNHLSHPHVVLINININR